MQERRSPQPAVLMALLLGCALPAHSHHSSAMFDKDVVREVHAVVKEFQWTNPHVWIQILIENESGDTEEWSIEGGGPNTLFRSGWRRDSFRPGDEIDIRFNPMRDGSAAGGFIGAKFGNGSTLGKWQVS
ncbi:MAG: DUF6152 family protein [Gammaproteobacteria bacterium]|nr:DUF6152 family protein [Gammaproteobacteria bacterium]MDH4254078.1 DUF6152 family protein [Gammaproteobacteria bacterium]MDH5310480.1 DUF6152 family protein [Gammaproteobacteria bacterium]